MNDDVMMRSTDSTITRLAAYACPRLVVYGSLAEITRIVGPNSNKDGGLVTGMMMSQA
jgi:hypothetical protein